VDREKWDRNGIDYQQVMMNLLGCRVKIFTITDRWIGLNWKFLMVFYILGRSGLPSFDDE
jgi:hypothetical protein